MRRINVVTTVVALGAAIGYILRPAVVPDIPEIVASNSCDMYGKNRSVYYLGLNRYSFDGREVTKNPTIEDEQNSWLVINQQIGRVDVHYFNSQESQWEDIELLTLFNTPSKLEIHSPDGYKVLIHAREMGETIVIIEGGMCLPEEQST